ncbi:TauD/TfdA dioxygenase family protein [Nocardia noduli]|uniref:TauD/TfdA dioxygenase family protein n=1 Tax=Nocardia noduli TaxID=2815722 RepID=UPI001C241EB1|nr:TauD/TfdA family dioxygenase [Nocardia noduli]
MAFDVRRLEPFGIEVTGMSSRQLLDHSADCRVALDEYWVVIYRGLDISDDDLIVFTHLLGVPVIANIGDHRYPQIAVITDDPAMANPVLDAYISGDSLWHIDGAAHTVPYDITLLTARHVGEGFSAATEFADAYIPYMTLPIGQRACLDKLRVVHSFAAAQLSANPHATQAEQAAWARIPDAIHPLVWTRRDGRRSLLLGATASRIVGLPDSKGQTMLDVLLEFVTRPEFVLRHRWCAGDLVIWDNAGMMHRCTLTEPNSPHTMLRTAIVGDTQALVDWTMATSHNPAGGIS